LEEGNFVILNNTIYKIEKEFQINYCMTLARERLNVDINLHTTMLRGGRGYGLLVKFYNNYKWESPTNYSETSNDLSKLSSM
jgi:hypothetical protein